MKPRVTTKRDLIRQVADRWEERYGKGDYGQDKLRILAELRSLDKEHCTESDVARVIGNTTWTRNECHACGQCVDVTVTVGEEPDYESCTATLCPGCLGDAVAALSAALATEPTS